MVTDTSPCGGEGGFGAPRENHGSNRGRMDQTEFTVSTSVSSIRPVLTGQRIPAASPFREEEAGVHAGLPIHPPSYFKSPPNRPAKPPVNDWTDEARPYPPVVEADADKPFGPLRLAVVLYVPPRRPPTSPVSPSCFTP